MPESVAQLIACPPLFADGHGFDILFWIINMKLEPEIYLNIFAKTCVNHHYENIFLKFTFFTKTKICHEIKAFAIIILKP